MVFVSHDSDKTDHSSKTLLNILVILHFIVPTFPIFAASSLLKKLLQWWFLPPPPPPLAKTEALGIEKKTENIFFKLLLIISAA